MSFEDWISQTTDDGPGGDEPARAFTNAARARAQAERERNRSLRRHTWRARAELARRRNDDTAGDAT